MKVCIVISTLGVGGLEKQTISLANELVRSIENDVTLYVVKEDLTLMKTVDPSVHLITHSLKETKLVLSIQVLRRFLKSNSFDSILVEESYAAFITTFAALNTKQFKCAAVVMHTTVLPNWQERLKNIAYRHLINLFKVKVFVSYAQKEYWVKKYHINGNCQVIQNSIDTNYFRSDSVPSLTLQTIKEELSIHPNDLVLVKLARMEKEKNDALLVDAVADLVQLKKPVKLLIVGDGGERAAIEKKVHDLHLEDSILVLGKKSDVRPFVAISDAGILPSYATETFSLAALEIMSMGKPMVMSDIGGAREIVDHEENGFIFESQNKQQLIAIILNILTMKSNGTLTHMSEKARQKIQDHYTLDVMIQKYNTLLCEIMKCPKPD